MSGVVGRIVKKRKDGAESTFKTYKGETKTALYQPVGRIFRNEGKDGSVYYTFKPESGGEDFFYNLYLEDGVEMTGEPQERPRNGGGNRGRKAPNDNEGGDPF